MRLQRLAFLSLLLTLASAAWSADKKTWELLPNGSWSPVTSQPSTRAAVIDDPTLDRAERLLFQKEYGDAKEILLDWEKNNKKSPSRDRCIYLLSEVFFQQGSRVKSFYYLDELMDEYPESPLFYSALEKQFKIAEEYLHGYKEKFLWVRILDRSDDGVEMMYRIQQRSPGSTLAERALLETADFYFSDQQYDVAQDAYTSYVRSYPRSAEVPRVRLRAAFSSLAQFRGVLFDPTAIIDARAQLLDIQKTYPELAAEENVASVIEQIDDAFARKILEMGDFYQRTHEIKGLVYQYRFLAETYPKSPEAATARIRLSKMPAWATAEINPPAASGYAPATEPSLTTTDLHP